MKDDSTALPDTPVRLHQAANGALPAEGFVRLRDIIGPGKPLPFSKSHWWQGIAEGRYPKPVKISAGITAWRVQDIRALIERSASQ